MYLYSMKLSKWQNFQVPISFACQASEIIDIVLMTTQTCYLCAKILRFLKLSDWLVILIIETLLTKMVELSKKYIIKII